MIITTTITMKIGKLWYNIIDNSKENKLRNYVSISKCRKEACKKIQVSTRHSIFFQAFFLQLRKLQLTCEDYSFT